MPSVKAPVQGAIRTEESNGQTAMALGAAEETKIPEMS